MPEDGSKSQEAALRSEEERWLDLELEAYSDKNNCPMHMPGHKRKSLVEFQNPLYSYDITEIEGFDNLHRPEGLIKELEKRISELYDVRAAVLTVGGSTAGVLSSITAMAGPNGGAVIARNCHASVYHALLLQGLFAEYVLPEPDGSINPGSVREALQNLRKKGVSPSLVVITSPTYEGVMSDASAIAAITHSFGAKLFVDSAHGAHLIGYEPDFFPESPIKCGADAAVVSFHKTLPALTMTSAILINDEELLPGIRGQLDIFETSSPSYLLMASVSKLVRLLLNDGRALMRSYRERLSRFYQIVRQFNDPAVMSFDGRDPGKIVIVSNKDVIDSLRDRYGIELEMAAEGYSLAMTSLSDDDEDLERLASALEELNRDNGISGRSVNTTYKPVIFSNTTIPRRACSIRDAYYSKKEELPLREAEGRISSDFVFDFPPGIPFLVPGELIEGPFKKPDRRIKVVRES